MTIACQSATTIVPITAPTGLSAQTMAITPAASPCYDPCTVTVDVTWINDTVGTLPAGQPIGITVDGVAPPGGSTTTVAPILVGGTVSYTFTVTGLVHGNPNLICPTPN